MNEKWLKEMRTMLANNSEILTTPIDFEDLIKKGLIKKVGKSYYTDNLHNLPKEVTYKIKNISNGRYGLKLTFYKESKSIKKIAKDFEQYSE